MIESYANYEWFLKSDFQEYSGKWLAIIDKKVVAAGDSILNAELMKIKGFI